MALLEYLARDSPELELPAGLDVNSFNECLRDEYGWRDGFLGADAHLISLTLPVQEDTEQEVHDLPADEENDLFPPVGPTDIL